LLKRIKHSIIYILWLIMPMAGQGQIQVINQDLKLKQDSLTEHILVRQKTILINTGQQSMDSLVWLNWANAYNNKHTPLARSIIENYNLNFHFTNKKNRGHVQVLQVIENNTPARLIHYKSDIYILKLSKALQPGDTVSISFEYDIKLPNAKFTGYGIDKYQNILLKNFFFQPVDYNQLYSEKNVDDYPASKTRFKIQLHEFDTSKAIISNLYGRGGDLWGHVKQPVVLITGQAYDSLKIGEQQFIFPADNAVNNIDKRLILIQISNFLKQYTGYDFPKKILITASDYKNRKVYGLDLLPKFVNPYDHNLLWELAVLHQLSFKYAVNLQTDRRRYPWITDGMAAYLEYAYLKKYYPNQKLLGKLAGYKLIKFYYASQIKLTEKYPWLYLYVARRNKDQALKTALDSLTNYNRNVAMPYKAALGLNMLHNVLGDSLFRAKMRQFYIFANKTPVSGVDFFKMVAGKESLWYTNFINTTHKYDYKLKRISKQGDSLQLHIINKRQVYIPLTVYTIQNDSVVLQKQLPVVKQDTSIYIKYHPDINFAGFNYFNDYPELQTKNNYKRPGFHLFEKPIQIRPYQDFDNPLKTQLFINPFIEYNYYDGVIAGAQIFNESLLYNHFNYTLTPGYATKSGTLTGSFSISNSHYFNHSKLFALGYGFGFKYFHYNHGLVYRKYNPRIELKWRDPYLRHRKGINLKLQYMYIDKDPIGQLPTDSDHYGIFNIKLKRYRINVIKDFFYTADLQLANRFGKISGMLRYRFLSDKNRQWDFRLYAGKFLYNHTQTDYFSFALDRPTDYLFQYHYYGRSETSGIFHQQFVWAEGGFKTFFDDQFANDYMISNNVNIGLWKWFNLYGDWAWLKNKQEPVRFYYDSGLRINLVQDYFEIFFPVYSKLGWEINQPDYASRIRIVFTIDINGLFKMLKRGWY